MRCLLRAIANHFNKLTRCALRYLLRAIGVASPLFLLRRFFNDFNGGVALISAGLRAFSPFGLMAHKAFDAAQNREAFDRSRRTERPSRPQAELAGGHACLDALADVKDA